MRRPVRRLLTWAHYRARGNRTLDHLAEIERSQWLPREQVLDLQLEKLRNLLVHCGERIPYYCDAFRKVGFDPKGLRRLEDLAQAPVLDREDIPTNAPRMVDPDAPAWARVSNATGGSGGTPVRFFQDRRFQQIKMANIYRNFRWCGWDVGERQAFLWGADIDSHEHAGWAGALRDWLYNVEFSNAFGVDEAGLDSFLDRLSRYPPRLLVGYASSLHELESRARTRARSCRVGAVVSSAEVLTPDLRRRLEETFGAPVFDRYGAREVSTIAFECPSHEGLHTIDEANLVEIEPGTDGNVLVTNLNNFTMPLVRYRLGDRAHRIEGACPCGRGLGRLTPVHGRIGDYLVAPSGRKVHSEFFTHLFYGSRGVRQFEVVQTSAEDLVVRIVKGPEYETAFEESLSRAVRDHADSAFLLRFEYPSELQRTRSGKLRFVRREIPS
jgi:phenylacetate-CoA ligase